MIKFILNNKNLFFLLLPFFLLISCKEELRPLPVITINFPQTGASFDIKEEIGYSIEVNGETEILSVIINLYNDDNVQIQQIGSFRPNSKHVEINSTFEIADTTLQTGRYYFKVFAEDDHYQVNKSISIQIRGVPLISLGMFVVTESSSKQTRIYQIDTLQQAILWSQYFGDFFDARLDNKYQQLYLFPKTIGKMRAIDLHTKSTIWNIPSQTSGMIQFFRGIDLIDNQLYVGDFSSYVRVYDHNKYLNKIMTLPSNYMGSHFLKSDLYRLIFEVPLNPGQHKRIVAYNIGDEIILDIIFNHDLKGWFFKNDDEIYLFYNDDEGFKIAVLSVSSSGINHLKGMSNIYISDVVRFSDDQFILATDEGIFPFKATQNSVFQLNSKRNISHLAINEDLQEIAASSGNELFIIALPHGYIKRSFELPHEVRKIFWHFNQ